MIEFCRTLFSGSQPALFTCKEKEPSLRLVPFSLEREKGLFARKIPCLRKVAVKPFGLALASLVSSAKFVSSHFVHEPNYANPLLGFSTHLYH